MGTPSITSTQYSVVDLQLQGFIRFRYQNFGIIHRNTLLCIPSQPTGFSITLSDTYYISSLLLKFKPVYNIFVCFANSDFTCITSLLWLNFYRHQQFIVTQINISVNSKHHPPTHFHIVLCIIILFTHFR